MPNKVLGMSVHELQKAQRDVLVFISELGKKNLTL
jgi:hypothetical protein